MKTLIKKLKEIRMRYRMDKAERLRGTVLDETTRSSYRNEAPQTQTEDTDEQGHRQGLQ